MRVGIRRIPALRWPRLPAWSLALLGGWGLLVGLSAWLESRTGVEATTCLFKGLSGHPCPTCGSTRAVLALARGDLKAALAWNPLLILASGVAAGLLLHRGMTRRALQVETDPAARRLIWGAGFTALLLNWAWVWPRG